MVAMEVMEEVAKHMEVVVVEGMGLEQMEAPMLVVEEDILVEVGMVDQVEEAVVEDMDQVVMLDSLEESELVVEEGVRMVLAVMVFVYYNIMLKGALRR